MRSNSSKAERKEERIQQLEKELAATKKKLSNQEKVVRLDEEQLNGFLNQLTDRIEWSTNRIVDESSKQVIVDTSPKQSEDGFSIVIKCFLGPLFIIFAVGIVCWLVNVGPQFWNAGWANRAVLFIVALAGVDSLILGIEIFKEKDRNYIVSLFSALVALTALIVTLVGQIKG